MHERLKKSELKESKLDGSPHMRHSVSETALESISIPIEEHTNGAVAPASPAATKVLLYSSMDAA